MVEDAVNHGNGGGLVGQEVAPLVEGPVTGEAQAASFIGGGNEAEEELTSGWVERREP